MIDPIWIESREIQAIHLTLLAQHGGSQGLRDENLLESALARPKNAFHYSDSPSLAQLAAAYGFALAKNHPFIDGNKRVALAAIGVFLDINGYDLIADQVDAVMTILKLAASEMTEAELAVWIAANSRPTAP
jgi:death-on-curing protein